MTSQFREHYSHNFRIDFNKIQVKATDCMSRLTLFFVFIYGLLFALLGSYLLNLTTASGSADFEALLSKSAFQARRIIPSDVFGISLIVLGIGIMVVCLFFAFRYKTIMIDNGVVTVKDHPIIGKPHSFTEEIRNYSGVRLRLKFCQYGLRSKNKFIIELYHKDSQKIIPLYISIHPKHVRALWKKYAMHFNLPPIHISDRGMVSKSMKDLNRSYPEVVKDWHLPKNFLVNKTHSADFICQKKDNKQLIQTRRVILDLYSTLNIAVILIFGALLAYTCYSHTIIIRFVWPALVIFFEIALLTGIVYAFLTLITRDILFLTDQTIVVFRKILKFNFRDSVIPISALKGLDIFFTPTTGRYCLALITDKKIVRVFNKLSPDDLRWIKCSIISEIIEE